MFKTYDLDKQKEFNVGDKVRVVYRAHDHEGGWMTVWLPTMDSMMEKEFIVAHEDGEYGLLLVTKEEYEDCLNNEEEFILAEGYWLPYFSLEKVTNSRPVNKGNFPHECPYCAAPAWNGGFFECSSYKCPTKGW